MIIVKYFTDWRVTLPDSEKEQIEKEIPKHISLTNNVQNGIK